MNKDTVYIEPEDDITDIIAKIEKSKEKIVALVPPKKAGVFRSVVNMKLIAKAGKTSGKTVVLVTVDPSITKLAAASKLPVTKNLQTAPTIPTVDDDIEESSTESVDENGKSEESNAPETPEDEENTDEDEEETEDNEEKAPSNEDDEDEEVEEEKPKSKKKSSKSKHRLIEWIKSRKKLSILIAVLCVALIGFIIWALFIAPAVDVFVSIKTDSNNFSEGVTFVKELSKENAAEGKLYLEERKIETSQEVNFEATGQKNRGEKATGEVSVYAYFPLNIQSSVQVSKDEVFTISGLSYKASENVVLTYDGNGKNQCANKENATSLVDYGCRINNTVPVVAVEPGTKYNIAASSSGWDTNARVFPYSEKPMSGGTDDIITVVQQIDIEKARNELKEANADENKEKLYDSIPEDSIILESTFKQETSAATSTPAVDEEVKEGTKPTLKTTTTTSVYIIDRTKLEEFIRTKVNLPEDKKIYEIRDAYIDGLRESDGNFIGKIKALYYTGPRLTESELVEKIKGKGLGDARREISDIDGVAEVKMNPSYPWVFVVPTDSNRITVSFEIKDQNGETIKDTPEEESKDTKNDNQNEKNSTSGDNKDNSAKKE